MNAVVYCRVSSKEQVEGTSLQSQQQACEEYAARHRIAILKTFVEEGESAKFADRTQLVELLSFCRDNKKAVDALLVWKLDRFARNVSDHYSIKALLLKYGVRVVSVTEPIDANPEGKLLETILAGFAQFDNDIRAVRTVQGMKRKLQEGIWPWRPPLGYEPPVRNSEKKTVPDRPSQPLFGQLQRVWKAFATGTYTKAEIRAMMRRMGIVTESGRPFGPQAVDRLFSNPYYAGLLVDRRTGERHPGQHQPLVTMEEFERVQAFTRNRSRSKPHTDANPDFPLRGSLRCSGCKMHLTGGVSRGHGGLYAYYQCQTGACPKSSFPVAPVHEEFEVNLDRIAIREAVVPFATREILAAFDRREKDATKRRATVTALCAAIDRQVSGLIEMRASQLLTDTEFLDQKNGLLRRRAAAMESLTRRRGSREELVARLRSVIPPLSNLRRTWLALKPADRKRFNRMLFPEGIVVGESRTAQTPLLFSVFRDLGARITGSVPPTEKTLNRLEADIIEFSDFVADVALPEKHSGTPVHIFRQQPDPSG